MRRFARTLANIAKRLKAENRFNLSDRAAAYLVAVNTENRWLEMQESNGRSGLAGGLARFTEPRYLEHADRARRELAVLARGREVIEWDERRVVRTAELHDDCAVAVVRLP